MARPLKPRTPLGERLIAARERLGFTKRDGFAERLGVPANTLGTYERGIAAPSPDLLATYHREFGVNVNWLVTGEGDMLDDPSRIPASPVVVEPATVKQLSAKIDRMSQAIGSMREGLSAGSSATMKYLPLRASAGGGAVVLDETDGVDMDMDMLAENLLGVRRKNILLLEIKGDSMEPTLFNNDVIVVDASDPKPGDDPDEKKVYVVSIEGELFAKRARWQEGGTLHWCSDNERYSPIPVNGEDFNRIKTIGRVTWLWRPI